MSLPEVVSDGDLIKSLKAARDSIAADLEACESMRDKAALYRQLSLYLNRIAELEPKKAEGDGIDEIAKRRAARRASPAKGSPRAKRSS